MPEIKFRGKRVDNSEWERGFYNGCYETATIDYLKNGIPYNICVIPETVGQYTGLKDECDKHEIYRGDILEFTIFDHNGADEQLTGVVEWSNGMFVIQTGADEYVLAWVLAQDDCTKVIGNIWDSPEQTP